MTISKTKIYGGVFLCLILCSLLLGQDNEQRDMNKPCRKFVETFYLAHSPFPGGQVPALESTLKDDRGVFSSDLFLQLSEDSEAQRKAGGDIVGLDFDPFLACQDCTLSYRVEKTTIRDGRCWAEVHRGGDEKASVTPELVFRDGRWVFVNFHYPNPERPEFENLLSLLKSLREFRARRAGAENKKH